MNQPEKKSKKSSKKPAANTVVRDWIIRGVVFGVLAILLLLALTDFRAKQAATATAEAWRAALRAKGENHDLPQSEFKSIPTKGSPSMTSVKSEVRSLNADIVETYTWKGTFRTYTVKVSFGLGNDPPVEEIAGP